MNIEYKNARVTSINFDHFCDTVTVVREIGTEVKAITFTLEEAISNGFINVEAIGGYFED